MPEDHGWRHQHLACLPDQSRRVLALPCGGDDPRSLSQVADRMGLTKSTVRGLEQRALRELRQRMRVALSA